MLITLLVGGERKERTSQSLHCTMSLISVRLSIINILTTPSTITAMPQAIASSLVVTLLLHPTRTCRRCRRNKPALQIDIGNQKQYRFLVERQIKHRSAHRYVWKQYVIVCVDIPANANTQKKSFMWSIFSKGVTNVKGQYAKV